jgi:xylulokinase
MEVEHRLGINAYHLLSDEASTVLPGSEGLVVLPYFAGERTPIHDGDARGLILGLTTYHTRRHLYRALLEGTAYALRHHFDLMAEVGVRPRRLVAAGGGSQDHLWTQIVSDVLGMPQECVAFPYGPALGDAYLAGLGIGLFADFRPLQDRFVRIGRRVAPRPGLTALYGQYYEIYRRLYERTMEQMHELARLARLRPDRFHAQ